MNTPRSTKDIAWLGGLLEGEASFQFKNGCPKIALQMTDRDVVARAADILGVPIGASSRKPKGKDTYKPVWHLGVHGKRALGWMMTLYQFLGERRQAKVREIIDLRLMSKYMPRKSRGEFVPATCHPSRPRRAGNLCKECWMRDYRQRTGKNGTHYRRLAQENA